MEEEIKNYEIVNDEKNGKDIAFKIFEVVSGFAIGALNAQKLLINTLETASKMYIYMQTNPNFDFYKDLSQFYDTTDLTVTLFSGVGIVIGAAILGHGFFSPKYKISKKGE
jgi:hypothetical protein